MPKTRPRDGKERERGGSSGEGGSALDLRSLADHDGALELGSPVDCDGGRELQGWRTRCGCGVALAGRGW